MSAPTAGDADGGAKPRRSDSAVDIPSGGADDSSLASGSGGWTQRGLRAAACCGSARALKAFTLSALCAAIVITSLFFAAGAPLGRAWAPQAARLLRCPHFGRISLPQRM